MAPRSANRILHGVRRQGTPRRPDASHLNGAPTRGCRARSTGMGKWVGVPRRIGTERPRGASMPKLLLPLALLCFLLSSASALADPPVPNQSPPSAAPEPFKNSAGDNAWMLTSTALVLLMTIPGL